MRLFNMLTMMLLGMATSAMALDPFMPTEGIVYNTSEASALQYNCKKTSHDTMSCNFVQSAIRNIANTNELDAEITKAKNEYKNNKNQFSSDDCKTFSQLNDVFSGKIKPPKGDELARLQGKKREDIIKLSKLAVELCKKNSEQNFINFVKFNHDKNVRTCSIYSSTFTQEFKLISNSSGVHGNWVVQSVPFGKCGIVQLSRFEPEQQLDGKITLWKYYSKKAITNPNAEAFPGVSCSKLDQNEYFYDWRSKDHAKYCDYIQFGI